MSDGPRAQGGEGPTTSGAKPSIAEVAAWLRRAAEQREGVEDLAPAARRTDAPATDREQRAGDGPPTPEPPSGSTLLDDGAVDAPPDVLPADEATPPVDEAGVVEAPPVDAPVDEAPVEAPADEARIDEATPVEEAPVEEAPADEALRAGEAAPADEEAPADGDAAVAPVTNEPADGDRDLAQPPREAARGGVDDQAGSEAEAALAAAGGEPGGAGAAPRPEDEAADPGAGVASGNGEASGDARPVTALRPFVIGGGPAGAAEMRIDTSPGVDDDEEEDLPASPADTTIAVGNGASTRTPPSDNEVIDLTDGVAVTDHGDTPVDQDQDEDGSPVEDDGEPTQAVTAVTAFDREQDDDDDAPGAAAGEDQRDEDAPAAAHRSMVSLFDLDLAELAARARAASERRERVEAAEAAATWSAAPAGMTTTAEVDEDQDGPADLDLRRDDEDPQGVVAGDVRLDDEADTAAVQEPGRTATVPATAMAAVTAAIQRRRVKRKRYPRGQLTERIGVLQRVRAMLGVVVLTVVLGVAAGAAIGAFLLFAAFAVRSAITSG